MNDQTLVRVSNSRADLAEKLEALFRFQLALIAIVIQSLALDVFHDKKWNSIRSKAAAVKLRDVWVIETGEEMLFAFEVTNNVFRVEAAANELERDFAIQLPILREINFAHAAAADERDNLIVANDLAGAECALAEERFGREVQGRDFNESAHTLLLLEKRGSLRMHRRIGATFFLQKRRPTFWPALDRGFDELCQPPGPIVRHGLRLQLVRAGARAWRSANRAKRASAKRRAPQRFRSLSSRRKTSVPPPRLPGD